MYSHPILSDEFNRTFERDYQIIRLIRVLVREGLLIGQCYVTVSGPPFIIIELITFSSLAIRYVKSANPNLSGQILLCT